MWCITLIDLWLLKNPCIPGIKPTWSWCMIFLICSWILFARILLRFLRLCSSVILACSFLFLWHLCLVLALGWWWPHRMSLAVSLPLQFSGRVWVGYCHCFSSKEQVFFNFVAAVTICRDFEAQENKVFHCFHCFPIYLPWSDGMDAMILVLWMLSFKQLSSRGSLVPLHFLP